MQVKHCLHLHRNPFFQKMNSDNRECLLQMKQRKLITSVVNWRDHRELPRFQRKKQTNNEKQAHKRKETQKNRAQTQKKNLRAYPLRGMFSQHLRNARKKEKKRKSMPFRKVLHFEKHPPPTPPTRPPCTPPSPAAH